MRERGQKKNAEEVQVPVVTQEAPPVTAPVPFPTTLNACGIPKIRCRLTTCACAGPVLRAIRQAAVKSVADP